MKWSFNLKFKTDNGDFKYLCTDYNKDAVIGNGLSTESEWQYACRLENNLVCNYPKICVGKNEHFKQVGLLVANRSVAREWETFILETSDDELQIKSNRPYRIKAYHGQYLCADIYRDQQTGNVVGGGGGYKIWANRLEAFQWESFTFFKKSDLPRIPTDITNLEIQNGDPIHIRTFNGSFLCAENGGNGVVNASRDNPDRWETFIIENITPLGDYVNTYTYPDTTLSLLENDDDLIFNIEGVKQVILDLTSAVIMRKAIRCLQGTLIFKCANFTGDDAIISNNGAQGSYGCDWKQNTLVPPKQPTGRNGSSESPLKQAEDGESGNSGKNGLYGCNGRNGGIGSGLMVDITVFSVANNAFTALTLISNGGNGGNGGCGGRAGDGGNGGNGGNGHILPSGDGGNGGSGGDGGVGGRGGNGGNGGEINCIIRDAYTDRSRLKTFSSGGNYGNHGESGEFGNGGSRGEPGHGLINGAHGQAGQNGNLRPGQDGRRGADSQPTIIFIQHE